MDRCRARVPRRDTACHASGHEHRRARHVRSGNHGRRRNAFALLSFGRALRSRHQPVARTLSFAAEFRKHEGGTLISLQCAFLAIACGVPFPSSRTRMDQTDGRRRWCSDKLPLAAGNTMSPSVVCTCTRELEAEALHIHTPLAAEPHTPEPRAYRSAHTIVAAAHTIAAVAPT